jgi:hypothetical protein
MAHGAEKYGKDSKHISHDSKAEKDNKKAIP